MAMDTDLVAQLNNAHARAVVAHTDFSTGLSAAHAQLTLNIASANAYDSRILNGFLASQLFDIGLVEAKSAYHSPVEPAAAPIATPVTKA